MARLRFYADATALIGLARIGRLDLLRLLPSPIFVTTRVWQEVVDDPRKPGVAGLQQARDDGLLAVVDEGDPTAFPQLDPGESTVLSAAAAVGAAVVIDERKARTLVNTDPSLRSSIREATGIIGLIVLAQRRGYLPAVRPLLDELIRQRFWISPAFYQDVLRAAGEL